MSFDVLYLFLNNYSLRFSVYFSFLFFSLSSLRGAENVIISSIRDDTAILLASCVRIMLPLAEFHDELRRLRCLARLDEILLLRWLLEGLLMSS